ncbi:histidine phosphatase superfamily [Spinellus fusiger]|nr:histidine phosphatase superfamily [Spinellus fusiger]
MIATIAHLDGTVPSSHTVSVHRRVDVQAPTEPNACYYGQLTTMGRHSMNQLGARLRSIYVDKLGFLPDTMDKNIMHIRSTDYPRTQESVLQMVAGGLYPSHKRKAGTAIELHIRDPREDTLFPNPNCHKLRVLAKEFSKRVSQICKEELKGIATRLKPYVEDVSLTSHPSVNGILDTLVAAKVHGFSLPEVVDDELLYAMEKVVVKEWFYGAMESPVMRRLGMGRLLGELRDAMVNRATGQDKGTAEADRRLAVYSGHDTTIAPLLILLNGFDERWPPFGSSLIFELFQQDTTVKNTTTAVKSTIAEQEKAYFVRVRYNQKLLHLPGCQDKDSHYSNGDQSLCTLEAFQKIIKEVVPTDWEKECQM